MKQAEPIDLHRIPQHVAIIMDGNGRWAQQRGQARTYGHQAGVEAVRTVTTEAVKLGVKYLTLYTFSTENWNRPADEVAALMTLLLDSIEEEIFMKNNVRFQVIGDMDRLPQVVQDRLRLCIDHTVANNAMALVLALSYSSRWELTEAARAMAREVAAGSLRPDDIDDGLVAAHLTTRDMPDPDLLIRTGGERRLSNYLLWQCAYTELYFCDTYWPDFDGQALRLAIADYQSRERRYGQTSEQVAINR